MQRKAGIFCLLCSLVLYGLLIFGLIVHLPQKADSFILLSWLVFPGVVGSWILYNRDRKKKW